ncbi:MAG: Cytochrome C biogenesis protein Transmembrane region [Mitsuokella multacida]|jgi:cytochrome c-type biogenesis protein
MQDVSFFMAVLAGFVSFASPCVVPMLPVFSMLLVQPEQAENAGHRYMMVTSFLAGFTLMFVLMGATASWLGQFLMLHGEAMRRVGAVLMIVMGAFMAGMVHSSFLSREFRPLLSSRLRGWGMFGVFLLGAAFSLGWTPCTGPVLAVILFYAGQTAKVWQGAWLLFAYALGFAVPFFLLTAVWQKYLVRLRVVYAWLPKLQAVSGYVLILFGLLVWFNEISRLIGWLWQFFPGM